MRRAAGGTPAVPGEHRGWHSRGYLPHFDAPHTIQSITFRLFDAVPAEVISAWKTDLRFRRDTPADDARSIELRRRIEKYEDAGYGSRRSITTATCGTRSTSKPRST